MNENVESGCSDGFKIRILFSNPLIRTFFFASLMEHGSVSTPMPVSMPNLKAATARIPDPVPMSRTVE